MTSILDTLYQIVGSFIPSQLLEIPFFAFLTNLFFFAFSCWIFSIFFIFPLKTAFEWAKGKIKGC